MVPLPTAGPTATIRTVSSKLSPFAEVWKLTKLVEEVNACALPGCTIKYDKFLPVMWRAVARGFVSHEHATFVARGLRHGFDAGVQRSKLKGRRVFKNYKSAIDAMDKVAGATQKRIETGKTLMLGDWVTAKEELFNDVEDFIIFPLGAVPKPLEPDEVRPASDHTKTGLNAVTDMTLLGHSLTANKMIAWLLRTGYFMYVSDVEAAFPMLPIAPWLWWFMLHRVILPSNRNRDTLCMHTHGDFGTRGMPGCFYIFYSCVVVGMARSEMVLTLPMVIYVDDNALIGPYEVQTNREMDKFQEWSEDVPGVHFKRLKDKRASQVQLYTGFWYNSLTRTRTLEEVKVVSYVDSLLDFSARRVSSLHELRSLGGKAQRAIMTFPPGAQCLVTNFFLLMAGLMLPWQKRRTSKEARFDAQFIAHLLQLNLGRGYFAYDQFRWGPGVRSDACKSSREAGGGYISQCGRYDFWRYGSAARKQPIDYLEGDSCLVAVEDLCMGWRRCMIPFGLDNLSFQRSEAKSRSRATRLNDLLKHLFVLQVRYDFVLASYWLSSEDNFLADDLSRDREEDFLAAVGTSGFLFPGAVLQRHPAARRVRTLGERPGAMASLRQLLDTYASNTMKDGPPVRRFSDSVPHARATLTNGLPAELLSRFEELLDNRWSNSSWRTIRTGMRRWREVAELWDWDVLIQTDDPERGAKLVTLVLHMVDDTDLVWSSIQSYVWGVRNFMMLQHQSDPVLGVDGWDRFSTACAVLCHVPAEPRRAIPLALISAILEALDPGKFEEAQFGLFMLILLFTFSRSECPCPKTFDGQDDFDVGRHWQVKDIRFVIEQGVKCLKIRFKMVKQDQRVERPQARGDGVDEPGDWAFVGDVPDTQFSVVRWYTHLLAHYREKRPLDGPFFMARDRSRPYTYSAGLSDLRHWLGVVGCEDPSLYGLHGFRVAGYNLSKAGNGEDLTVAHGLWMSSAHTRYERFPMSQYLAIPANMVRVEVPEAQPAAPALRDVSAQRTTVVRGGAESAPTTDEDLLPPGYARVGSSSMYKGPGGHLFYSRVECWQDHDDTRRESVSSWGGSSRGSPVLGHVSSRRRRRAQIRPIDEGEARSSTRSPLPPQPGSAAAASSVTDIVPEFERPSARRPPVARSGGF